MRLEVLETVGLLLGHCESVCDDQGGELEWFRRRPFRHSPNLHPLHTLQKSRQRFHLGHDDQYPHPRCHHRHLRLQCSRGSGHGAGDYCYRPARLTVSEGFQARDEIVWEQTWRSKVSCSPESKVSSSLSVLAVSSSFLGGDGAREAGLGLPRGPPMYLAILDAT